MIQRVQTLYLGIAIILLSIVSVGTELFSFLSETSRFTYNSWGITEYSLETNEVVGTQSFPVFIGFIALTLLCFLTLMSYKNLKRQLKLGRMVFYLYFVSLISVFFLSLYGGSLLDTEITGREMGLGYWLFICGFPFTFLANTGIKRDKNLLDSVNRLR